MIIFKPYLLQLNVTQTPNVLKGYIKLFTVDIFKSLHSENTNIHLLLLVQVEFLEGTMVKSIQLAANHLTSPDN